MSTPLSTRVPTQVAVTPAMFEPFEPYPNAQYLCPVHDLGDIGER